MPRSSSADWIASTRCGIEAERWRTELSVARFIVMIAPHMRVGRLRIVTRAFVPVLAGGHTVAFAADCSPLLQNQTVTKIMRQTSFHLRLILFGPRACFDRFYLQLNTP
jgi:hypothetical protein